MLCGVVLFNLSEFPLTVENPKSALHFAKNDFSV